MSQSAASTHLLWNSEDILEVLESKETEGVVVAYLCGHYHQGGRAFRNGIHFWTLKGILEAPHNSNCYAIVHVFQNRIEIEGFGTEETSTLTFGKI